MQKLSSSFVWLTTLQVALKQAEVRVKHWFIWRLISHFRPFRRRASGWTCRLLGAVGRVLPQHGHEPGG